LLASRRRLQKILQFCGETNSDQRIVPTSDDVLYRQGDKYSARGKMEHAHNPYAPSKASLGAMDIGAGHSGHLAWREGKVLILQRDGDLPSRCVKCNDEADAPTKSRTLYWHHPGYYLLLLINVILYVIVALIARKRVKVSPGLCVAHKQRRARGVMIGWGGLIVGLLALFFSAANDMPGLTVVAILALLATVIAGLLMARVVYATRIDKKFVRIKGCGEEFLATLPEYRRGTRDG